MTSEGRERRATVLVVDDDASTRRSLVTALEQQGHVAIEAHDGIEGLQLLQEIEPDLMLLGVAMARLDGFGVLAAMQDLPSVARTPVLMISRTGDGSAVIRCMQMGADDLLATPVDAGVLRARVQAGLDQKRPSGRR